MQCSRQIFGHDFEIINNIMIEDISYCKFDSYRADNQNGNL